MIYFFLVTSALTVANGATLHIMGITPMIDFVDDGDQLTLLHNATEDELVCSGKFKATDVLIEGTSTTLADLIGEMATVRQEMADVKAFLGMMPPPAMPPPPSPPWNFVNLGSVAPTDDPAIGVLTSTGEVYFKPTPNDFSSSCGAQLTYGCPAFPVQIVAPSTANYDVRLNMRHGSTEFGGDSNSPCRCEKVNNYGNTDSFYVCPFEPDSTLCDFTSCIYYAGNGQVTRRIDLQAGSNTLWIAAREFCTLASSLEVIQ